MYFQLTKNKFRKKRENDCQKFYFDYQQPILIRRKINIKKFKKLIANRIIFYYRWNEQMRLKLIQCIHF